MSDQLVLKAGGLVYSGWTQARITRHLEHMAADFEIEVSERWSTGGQQCRIPPMTRCTIALGPDLVLTGFTDDYDAALGATSHTVRIAGRSKTMDLVDCMPPIQGAQFLGSSVDAIARAVAAYFEIGVLVTAPDLTTVFPQASYELTETAFAYLSRLCALSGVLAFDDAFGNLVLAQAGTASARGALVEGENGVDLKARISARERFSDYAVLAQTPLAEDDVAADPGVIGTAQDPSVTRFRRFAEMAENAADEGLAADRARWRALRNAGRGTIVNATVPGWRQNSDAGAPLWQVNQIVPVKSPRLWLDRTLLIVGVTFLLDERGSRTELTLSPQEAYTPDPASVKLKGAAATANFWNSVHPID